MYIALYESVKDKVYQNLATYAMVLLYI